MATSTGARPHGDPDRSPEAVVDQEAATFHAGGARDDPVEFAQPDDKPRDHDKDAPVLHDDCLGTVEMMRTDEHVPAVPQDDGTAAEPADGVANLCAGKAAHRGDHADDGDVQTGPARASEDRSGDQAKLARHHRDADVLQEQEQGDRPVSVVVQRAYNGLEEAGQRHAARQGLEHAHLLETGAEPPNQLRSCPRRMAYRNIRSGPRLRPEAA
jgi:hypothetical protein